MEIIQEVGSYAGFAAVVGLAVLSALYFSQARDLRRLREWAGRAPERAAEQATQMPEQAAQQAVRPAPTGAVKPIPSVKPVAAAASGAGPATAVQPPPSKPGQPGPPKPGEKDGEDGYAAKDGEGPKPGEAGKPGATPPLPATAAATGTKPAPTSPGAAPPVKPVTPGGPPKPPPVTAPRPALPGRAPGASPARAGAPSQSTAVLPASQRPRQTATPTRGRTRGRTGGPPSRYLALLVAGVVVIGGALAFGISQLGGDGGSSDDGQEQPAADAESTAPVNPSTVTVSVLNGTTVPGLAAQIGDEVESGGFQRGNVANAIDQQRAESVVLFAEAAEREARLVARKLGISQIEPVDPDSQALAGNASVVVIVGADRTQ